MMEIQPHSTNVRLLLMSAKIAANEDNSKALNYLDAAANLLLKNCEGLPYGYEYLSELRPDLCLEIAKQRLLYSLNKSPMSDEVSNLYLSNLKESILHYERDLSCIGIVPMVSKSSMRWHFFF